MLLSSGLKIQHKYIYKKWSSIQNIKKSIKLAEFIGRQDIGSILMAGGVTEIVQHVDSFPLYSVLMQGIHSGATGLLAMILGVIVVFSYYCRNSCEHINQSRCQFVNTVFPIHLPTRFCLKTPHPHSQQLIGNPIQLKAEHLTDTCTCGGPTSTVPSPTMNTKLPSIPANLQTPSLALTLM